MGDKSIKGKSKILLTTKGNLVVVKDKPDTIIFDVTETLKKQTPTPKKKGQTTPRSRAGRFNRGEKV